jgi:hypothetical protein
VHDPLRDRPHWWQWPTVLSLDAPAVAAAWQGLFGQIGGVRVGRPEAAVLAMSVWLAYAADRWFEGWRVAPAHMRTQRHRFYQQHRWAIAAIWVAVVAADLAIAFLELSARELTAGVLLLVPTLLYVFSHQLVHRHSRWRLPKEACIAFLIAGGAVIFVVASPGISAVRMAGPAALFAALCFVNVALIAVWEQEVDESHGQVSLARQFRRGASVGRAMPWALLLICGGLAAAAKWISPVAVACVGSSALLLGLTDAFEEKLGWQLARVLADAALLTPLVPLLHRLTA